MHYFFCGAKAQIGPPLVLRCLRHTILDTHTHTQTTRALTHGRSPLNEWSARRRGSYLHNTQQMQDTNTRAISWIWTRDTSTRRLAP